MTVNMFLDLPKRTEKPRTKGITAVTDIGLPLRELEMILESYGEFLDIAKFGIGSGYVCPKLRDKLALYEQYGVITYLGGTLFEKFLSQDNVEGYMRYLEQHGIGWVEISSGVKDAPLDFLLSLIARFNKNFDVLVEIGCKDADIVMPPSEWIQKASACLDAGCRYVITEGRNSGTAGIYRASGEIRTGLVYDLVKSVGADRLIFEAPTFASQAYFVNFVGANVNLGNINPRDLLHLETQRRGLRFETFGTKTS